jgi:hypothetical protein
LKKVATQEWINKALISSEIAIRLLNMGAKIIEVPITYNQRIGYSRGLPANKIPGVIYRVLKNFPRLKKAVKQLN